MLSSDPGLRAIRVTSGADRPRRLRPDFLSCGERSGRVSCPADPGLRLLSGRTIVRSLSTFVNAQTTRYWDDLLGQSQYLDTSILSP